MKISRLLNPELIKLELETRIPEDFEEIENPKIRILKIKELILWELVELLDNSNKVPNKHKLFLDLFNREKKATTGIGQGIALPHVRTMNIREFQMGFARSTKGIEFDSLDGQPTHLFFIIASPPYDDELYLKIYKALAEILKYEELRESLLQVESVEEVIGAIQRWE